MGLQQLYRFDNGQEQTVVIFEIDKKNKVHLHREVNVIAESEEAARVKAARPKYHDELSLPDSYNLVKSSILASTGTDMPPELYPFSFDDHYARSLIMTYAKEEFADETRSRMYAPHTEYEYHATLLENGDVQVYVRYSYRSPGIRSCGSICRKTIRPFDDEWLAEFKKKLMMEHASKEYFRRIDEQHNENIKKLAEEIFGEAL